MKHLITFLLLVSALTALAQDNCWCPHQMAYFNGKYWTGWQTTNLIGSKYNTHVGWPAYFNPYASPGFLQKADTVKPHKKNNSKDTILGTLSRAKDYFNAPMPFYGVEPNPDYTNAYNFYIGMGAGAGIERGSFNIIVKEYGLSQVTDTSFAFMVDYNSPMIKNHSMLKQYLYQIDLLFQDNPDLRKDTLFQIAIHKQLNGMFNFR